jgi:threonine/homoserine/homoserine lactone efflux protein
MAQGARGALALGLGLAVGLAFWGVVAAAGLGALLARSATALLVLRVLGGGYLLYLAWQSARAALAPEAAATARAGTGGRLFRRGLILNLTNPKAVLAWTAVLALGAGPGTDAGALALATAACALLGAAIYAAYALAFARPAVRAAYARARRAIDAAAAAFFGYAGVRLLAARGEAP